MSGEYSLKHRLRVGVFAHLAGTSGRWPVYRDMQRTTLIIVSVLLAVPALAHAKGGLEFSQDPVSSEPGRPIAFTVMGYRDPPPNGGMGHPVSGTRPLVTFRSTSGRVVRVRAGVTNADGISRGTVTFPDAGPWTTQIDMRGLHLPPDRSEPITIGPGSGPNVSPLVISTPPRTVNPKPEAPGGEFPWVWILSGASILAALVVAGMRRRRHWGTA
jgi:hypothetical protein